ncbi:ABC transporter ATP-binding protein [Actinorhabdospora filicis]|uniref:ABC transporter ATP-binding protein n=1 Tax=Actinorhabdospora filicis TaxID=1785913 RepID=A0A9W6SQ74_9ACTN|nr:ABC transporter ATP-binding protein [Actinorhabdospora filicis]GLZ79862.1 ABC transporter ATP-binding protein [Actinorhabdospora filicis]
MLLRHVRPHWPLALAVAVLLLAQTAAGLAGPGLLGSFVDAVAGGAAPVSTGSLLALVVLGGTAATVAAEAAGGRLAWRATNALREDLLRHCLDADLDFHARHSPGELISRIDGDTGKLAGLASRLILLVAVNALLLTGVCAMVWLIDWRVGLGCALLFASGLAMVRRTIGAAVTVTAEAARLAAGIGGYVEEHVRGAEDVTANGATAHVLRGLVIRGRELYRARRLSALTQVRWPRAAQHMAWIGTVGGLAAAVVLHRAGAISLGEVYAVLAYLTLTRMPLMIVAGQMSQVDEALAAIRRCRELLAERPSIAPGTTPLPSGALSVELDAVDFAYADAPVLRGLSLSVPAGSTLALVGVSGGGKTTIARLVTRALLPGAGAVRLGGVDTREAEPESLRASIGYVTQEVRVMALPVRDNLTLFDPDVADADVVAALEEVGLGGWLAALPDGLDTVLGAAAGLSAGEEQLLAAARVLLRDPGLVVLDEASSRIAPGDRAAVAAAMDRLTAGRTAIVIAHRLDTVAGADEVAVIADGRVAERGSFADLAATGGSLLAHALEAGR